MNLAEFETLLKQAIGLDAASIGTSSVTRAVTQRMSALGHTDAAAYAALVRASAVELQALVEAVVVPETWFFRDREAFTALTRFVQEDWLPQHRERTFRAGSLPCSTGEEPYSIAMALLDAGMPPSRFHVDAIDVSAEALARARSGVYGKNSFRGANPGFRERYFRGEGQRWTVIEPVQRQVRFERGNVLDAALATNREPYDALFCRNLLIYFDRETQDRAVAALTRLLAPEGMLFVGPSETGLWLSHGFEPVRVPLAFAFRRAQPKPRERVVEPIAAPRPPPTAIRPIRPRAKPAATVLPPPKPRPSVAVKDPLDEIARLANGGHLAEAARLCEALVHEDSRSAKALYLLGVVRDATGKHMEAAQLYRKALYLEPDHHEALMHLAYLLEGQGDAAGAQVLTARARRVAQRRKDNR